jgi:hypothetical protein
MKRFTGSCAKASGLALMALGLLSLTVPGQAQVETQMPFQATATLVNQDLLIPGQPSVLSQQSTGTLQASGVGSFTMATHHLTTLGADGSAMAVTNGISACVAANGTDALFIEYSGLASGTVSIASTRATESPKEVFFVKGGKGQFAGASGSGVLTRQTQTISPNRSETTLVFNGILILPRR